MMPVRPTGATRRWRLGRRQTRARRRPCALVIGGTPLWTGGAANHAPRDGPPRRPPAGTPAPLWWSPARAAASPTTRAHARRRGRWPLPRPPTHGRRGIQLTRAPASRRMRRRRRGCGWRPAGPTRASHRSPGWRAL
eukprot:scaffold12034_cov155-Isochrysis_galbana.AAC.6